MACVKGKGLQTTGPDECTLMTEEHPVGIMGRFCLFYVLSLDDVPVDDIGLLRFLKHPLEGVCRCEGVTRIHKDDPLALGQSHPFVHRIIDAQVWFGNPLCDGTLVLPYHLHGPVCRCPVDDEEFFLLPGLALHTLDGFLQPLAWLRQTVMTVTGILFIGYRS